MAWQNGRQAITWTIMICKFIYPTINDLIIVKHNTKMTLLPQIYGTVTLILHISVAKWSKCLSCGFKGHLKLPNSVHQDIPFSKTFLFQLSAIQFINRVTKIIDFKTTQVLNGTLKWKGGHRSAQGPHNTISWTKIAKIDYLGHLCWLITNISNNFSPV